MDMRELDPDERAAVRLQSLRRGRASRRSFQMNRHKLEQQREDVRSTRARIGSLRHGPSIGSVVHFAAATALAARARGGAQRKQFTRARSAAVLIASEARMRAARRWYVGVKASAVRIQGEWRLHEEQRRADNEGRCVRRVDRSLALTLVRACARAFRERDEGMLHRYTSAGFEYSLDLDHGMGAHTVGLAAYLANEFLARQGPILMRRGRVFKPLTALTSTSIVTEISMGVADVHVEYTVRHRRAHRHVSPREQAAGAATAGPVITRVRVTPRHPFGGPGLVRGSASDLALERTARCAMRTPSPAARSSPAGPLTSPARSPGERLWPVELGTAELLASPATPLGPASSALRDEVAALVAVASTSRHRGLPPEDRARAWKALRAREIVEQRAGGMTKARMSRAPHTVDHVRVEMKWRSPHLGAPRSKSCLSLGSSTRRRWR